MISTVILQDPNTPIFASNDRIFLGEGLVETIGVVQSKACYSEWHWQRLHSSARLLTISLDLNFDEWQEQLFSCIKSARLVDGGVKVILSGGLASRGLVQQGVNPTLVLQAFKYQKNDTPLKLVSAPWLRDANNPMYTVKSVNYLEAIMACRYAEEAKADDVLFFNLNHDATETSIANFFIVYNQSIITPDLASGVLDGITRRRILEICEKHNIPYKEMPINKNLLDKAEAFFTCNALQGIRVVTLLDNLVFDHNHWLINQLKQLMQ